MLNNFEYDIVTLTFLGNLPTRSVTMQLTISATDENVKAISYLLSKNPIILINYSILQSYAPN